MKTAEFYYELPEELIAQDPLADRASSRLLYLDRKSGSYTDDTFRSIGHYLRPGDVLVRNTTRVIPARLFGTKTETGARIEILLLKRESDTDWEALARPGRKIAEGTQLRFGDGSLCGIVREKRDEGRIRISFQFEGIFEEILDRLGTMPLPPYIHKPLADRERYQTVYAKEEGSAAAPTAGLHFTEALFGELKDRGIEVVDVLLHVGLGTFRPVKEEDVEAHVMHEEYYEISPAAASSINAAKDEGRRVICVGTTSCRVVESAGAGGRLNAGSGHTNIFIYPGYRFRIMDGLITNFHLPESTLLMLVSAFAGKEEVLAAYEHAVRERYRFFSFGDAMLLL